MEIPNALVVSYSDLDTDYLIKGILRTENLPNTVDCYEKNISTYLWNIETKYYTASIHLCTIKDDKFGSNSNILENMQALVAVFDSQQEASFTRVKMLMSIISGYEPDVRILVCNNCSETSVVTKAAIQSWCLKNSFELVELNPEEDSDTDDDFAETVGIDRIIQALHSHTWSNLILKGKQTLLSKGDKTQSTKSDVNSLEDRPSDPAAENLEAAAGCADTNDKDLEDILKNLTTDDDQSFEGLFEKFQIMKDKAKEMNFEERKVYAEQVAVAFWRAIGGDEEEIANLNFDN